MTENNQIKSVKRKPYKEKSPSRGGARNNAGRKPGAATTKTREIAEKAMLEGITPLEVMLLSMREYVAKANAIGEDPKVIDNKAVTRLGLLREAASIAKDAAPFVHPRLAAIEHTGKDGKDLVQRSGVLVVPPTLTLEEWENAVAQANQ